MTARDSAPSPPHPDRHVTTVTSPHLSRDALNRDFSRLYDDLRVLARRQLGNDRAGHTLSPTALVHEAYLKLADLSGGEWRTRPQFFALASRAMRHTLVDYARGRNAAKRGGGVIQVTLNPEMARVEHTTIDLLCLDEAMSRVGALSERMERIVECKVFGGLTTPEIAEALEISVRTVERDWTRARAYLFQILSADAG